MFYYVTYGADVIAPIGTLCWLHKVFTIDIMPELKRNVLNFRYGANFKYEGMLTHSFDKFYDWLSTRYPK